MSGLNPGGKRDNGNGLRVFGARNIARHCERARVPAVDRANGSIAQVPHQHSREQQRRLRQAARAAASTSHAGEE